MIHSIIRAMPLLATWQESEGIWGRFDHQRPTLGVNELIILGVVIAAIVGTLIWQLIAGRRLHDFRCNSASRLFGELCRVHRLGRTSRKLLKQLAVARSLKSADLLFVEPEYFDLTNIPPALKSSANELRQLRHRLFD